jgi:hypothetical protein
MIIVKMACYFEKSPPDKAFTGFDGFASNQNQRLTENIRDF